MDRGNFGKRNWIGKLAVFSLLFISLSGVAFAGSGAVIANAVNDYKFEELFYITSALSVTLLGILLTRNEASGSANSRIDALARENTELRQKLKKEAEDRDHILHQIRNYYDQRVEWKKQEIKKGNVVHDDEKWAYDFDKLLTGIEFNFEGPYWHAQIEKQRAAMEAQFRPKP